ncbi:Transglycosylase SLT domain-containing protein [Rhizobiales bacterium GAS113]|nr:Transglycosylase SLT domain-containing protein [Rhizobiales bacterium GAS113]
MSRRAPLAGLALAASLLFDGSPPLRAEPQPLQEMDKLAQGLVAQDLAAAGFPLRYRHGRALYREVVKAAAERAGLPAEIVDAVIRTESGYDPNVTGTVGEVGLMQVRPSTARLLGFTGTLEEMREPHANIALGVAYLAGAWRLANGDICTAVMKYRAGHGETRFSARSIDYCLRVRSYLAEANYPVTGEVPSPSFGFIDTGPRWGFGTGSVAAARRLASHRKLRSRVAWRSYDQQMKTLDARARSSMSIIMR